jgi:hypothetical protein
LPSGAVNLNCRQSVDSSTSEVFFGNNQSYWYVITMYRRRNSLVSYCMALSLWYYLPIKIIARPNHYQQKKERPASPFKKFGKIIFVRVFKQYDPVGCGYHALHNAQLLMNDLIAHSAKPISQRAKDPIIEQLMNGQDYKRDHDCWQKILNKEAHAPLSNLDIKELLTFHLAKKIAHKIDVLCDRYDCKRLHEIIEQLQASTEPFVHGLIVMDTVERHWFAAVLHKTNDTSVYCIIADSNNMPFNLTPATISQKAHTFLNHHGYSHEFVQLINYVINAQ